MAHTKALISLAVTVKLICVFVFAYTKSWFSHNEAHFLLLELWRSVQFSTQFSRKKKSQVIDCKTLINYSTLIKTKVID